MLIFSQISSGWLENLHPGNDCVHKIKNCTTLHSFLPCVTSVWSRNFFLCLVSIFWQDEDLIYSDRITNCPKLWSDLIHHASLLSGSLENKLLSATNICHLASSYGSTCWHVFAPQFLWFCVQLGLSFIHTTDLWGCFWIDFFQVDHFRQ